MTSLEGIEIGAMRVIEDDAEDTTSNLSSSTKKAAQNNTNGLRLSLIGSKDDPRLGRKLLLRKLGMETVTGGIAL